MTDRRNIMLFALTAVAAATIATEAARERAFGLPPSARKARLDLAAFHVATGRPAGAIPLLDSVQQREPDSVYLALKLAAARFAAGDFAGAEKEYRRLVTSHPDCPPAEYNLALALRAQGRSTEAQPLLQAFTNKYDAVLPDAASGAALLLQHPASRAL